ncbi:solute carrier family 30 (zinc transporter), member 5 [Angomonas deanei]|nr:solute carrier family 30 (zinc transporter), member 5 [Angomonas deanei]|eukprot:EPY34803.1 solute carrier family 30 (zinc transporter), member 5 [Angomonas deanei]
MPKSPKMFKVVPAVVFCVNIALLFCASDFAVVPLLFFCSIVVLSAVVTYAEFSPSFIECFCASVLCATGSFFTSDTIVAVDLAHYTVPLITVVVAAQKVFVGFRVNSFAFGIIAVSAYCVSATDRGLLSSVVSGEYETRTEIGILITMAVFVQFSASVSTNRNAFRNVLETIGTLLRRRREKKLFLFLLLTLAVMVLEFVYGISSNSLGLVSDSFHMLLDATSIVIGLCTAFASSWDPNKNHPFGFARYEVLSGFLNGVLLVFIAVFVVVESIERILDPPEVETTYLLTVSVIGLLVNAIGVVFFHEFHTHAPGECSHDHNMQGVYLHIMADLLGSVSVILSSLLIHFFNYVKSDAICSVITAVMIFLSAVPLLKETGKVLLLSGPSENVCVLIRQNFEQHISIGALEDVKIWNNSTAPRDLSVCLLTFKLKPTADYHESKKIIKARAESILRGCGELTNFVVMVHAE